MLEIHHNGEPTPNPSDVLIGPKVLLVSNACTSRLGRRPFPYRFRAAGLGKIIGERTWGGVVGIQGSSAAR